jgi:hypothetical protein
MANVKYRKTIAVMPTRFVEGVQARNREILEIYLLQMVMKDRAEMAPAPLWLLEPEGSA